MPEKALQGLRFKIGAALSSKPAQFVYFVMIVVLSGLFSQLFDLAKDQAIFGSWPIFGRQILVLYLIFTIATPIALACYFIWLQKNALHQKPDRGDSRR